MIRAFGRNNADGIFAPSTRYQGSKNKLLPWIYDSVRDLPFHSALDVFGGTGSVAFLLKQMGKAVTYNDYLRFNQQVGKALIENQGEKLVEDDLSFLLRQDPCFPYAGVITQTFQDTFFTDAENAWLDTICQNIPRLPGEMKRALSYTALFQSCLVKRPYNLFHRKNLYLRTANVARSFGNKSSWDAPFEKHFRSFVDEINRVVFDSGTACQAICYDALDAPGEYDLVYIDPPYVNAKGSGVDYLDFYHFLEGLVDYPNWAGRIDYRRMHRPLRGQRSPWSDKKQIRDAFVMLFRKFRRSILVVSYRSDGIPCEHELVEMLREIKPNVQVYHSAEYQYALSTNARSRELLLVGC